MTHFKLLKTRVCNLFEFRTGAMKIILWNIYGFDMDFDMGHFIVCNDKLISAYFYE